MYYIRLEFKLEYILRPPRDVRCFIQRLRIPAKKP